jgi:chromosome segregation ATPase
MNGMRRRKAESRAYDKQKEMQLQDDEITRLNSELRSLTRQISRMTDHFQQKESVNKAQISQLKQEIGAVTRQRATTKAKLLSEHTKAVAALQAQHRSVLDGLKSEYNSKLGLSQPSGSQAKVKDGLLDSINSTRSQISDELEQKEERREIQAQAKLVRLTSRITEDRRRARDLEKRVEEMKKELEKVKTVSSLRQAELGLAIPVLDTTAEDEHLEITKSNYLAEENQQRAGFQKQIDGWRVQLKGILAKSAMLQKRIRERETDDTEALALAREEHEELKDVCATLREGLTRGRKEAIDDRIDKEHQQQNKVSELRETAQVDLKEVKAERERLLAELRRLDFMLYGRSGQYQKPKDRVARRPLP